MSYLVEVSDATTGRLYGWVVTEMYHHHHGGMQAIKMDQCPPTMEFKEIDTIPWTSWKPVPSYRYLLQWKSRGYCHPIK